MKTLGIDQSLTCSGWCLVENGKLKDFGMVKPPPFNKKDPANLKRFLHIYLDFEKLIMDEQPELMVLETYFAGSKGRRNGMTVVPELRGVLKLLAAKWDIKFAEYAPQTVRCGLLGKGHGHADKEEVADWVEEEYSVRPEPLDVTDAIAIAVYGERKEMEANKNG